MITPFALAERRDLSPSAKLLLCRLRDRIGGNCECWAGQRRLAEDIGLTNPKGVVRAVAELEGAGLILVARCTRGPDGKPIGAQSGRLNRYSLTPAGTALFANPSVPETGTLPAASVPLSTTSVPETGTLSVPETGTEQEKDQQEPRTRQIATTFGGRGQYEQRIEVPIG